MNRTLKNALREIEALPEPEQEELARELLGMAVRKRVDAELAASEAEGGKYRMKRSFAGSRAA